LQATKAFVIEPSDTDEIVSNFRGRAALGAPFVWPLEAHRGGIA
jgi:hypothetical protein